MGENCHLRISHCTQMVNSDVTFTLDSRKFCSQRESYCLPLILIKEKTILLCGESNFPPQPVFHLQTTSHFLYETFRVRFLFWSNFLSVDFLLSSLCQVTKHISSFPMWNIFFMTYDLSFSSQNRENHQKATATLQRFHSSIYWLHCITYRPAHPNLEF